MTRKSPRAANSKRASLARFLLFIGIFCLFPQVTGALHWALVEHERCAEHGEWVHAGDEHHPRAAKAAPSTQAAAVSAGAGEHEHDHCQFLVDRREPALRPVGVTLRSAALIQVPASIEGRAATVTLAAVYELAPKTSPPGAELS